MAHCFKAEINLQRNQVEDEYQFMALERSRRSDRGCSLREPLQRAPRLEVSCSRYNCHPWAQSKKFNIIKRLA